MSGRGRRTAALVVVAAALIAGTGCGSQSEEAAPQQGEAQTDKACLQRALADGGSARALRRCADEAEAAAKRKLEHPSQEAERIIRERAAEREASEIEAGG